MGNSQSCQIQFEYYEVKPNSTSSIPETIGAITHFQQQFTQVVDGRVDPGRETITQLEAFHLAGIFSAEAYPTVMKYIPMREPDATMIARTYEIYLRDLRKGLD